MRLNPNRFIPAAAIALALATCFSVTAATPVPAAPAPYGAAVADSTITAKVKAALRGDARVRKFDIKVMTLNGDVQLAGFVDTIDQIEWVVDAAEKVQGVVSIADNITLTTGAKRTLSQTIRDTVITGRIKSALRADPIVNSFDFNVVTRKGEALLSGFVANQAQVDRAVALARGVPGVTSIAIEVNIKK